jgi:hypothetical protein
MGDKVRMMFGLVNQNKAPKAKPGEKKGGKKIAADQLAKIEIFHRSRDKKDVVGAENFTKADLPAGFLGELKAFVGAPQGSQDPTRHRASQVHRHQRRGGRSGHIHGIGQHVEQCAVQQRRELAADQRLEGACGLLPGGIPASL